MREAHYVQVRIRALRGGAYRLAVNVNDHYEFTPVSSSDSAMDALEKNWDASRKQADEIFGTLLR